MLWFSLHHYCHRYYCQNLQLFINILNPPDSIEVDIVVVMAEEEEGKPGLKSINWDDEQDPDNPTLLRRIGVIPGGIQKFIYKKYNEGSRQKYVSHS